MESWNRRITISTSAPSGKWLSRNDYDLLNNTAYYSNHVLSPRHPILPFCGNEDSETLMAKKKSLYGVHPGVAMVAKWIEDLPAKSGHSLDEWLKIIQRDGPKGEVERRDWLKKEHGFGTNNAWWLAERSVGKGGEEDSPEAYLKQAEIYVQEMFAGKKEGLTPIYDALLDLGLKQGKDVKACP